MFYRNLILSISLCTVLSSCDQVKSILDDVGGEDVPVERTQGSKYVMSGDRAQIDKWKAEPNVFVVVDFYSDSCGPCQRLGSSLRTMASKYGDKAVILKVDVTRHQELAKEYGVSSIPHVRCYLNGEEVEKFVGAKSEQQLESIFAKHTGKIDDSIPVAEKKEPEKSNQPMFAEKKKGDLPPGVQRVKVPDEITGSLEIQSPKAKSTEKKPVVDMGPPPEELEAEKGKQ